MRILTVIVIGLLLMPLFGCKAEKSGTIAEKNDTITVMVSPQIMKEIKLLDPKVVFFASAKHPIHNLTEIKNESEIGFFGLWNEPRCKLFDIIVLSGLRKSNPCNPPFPSDTVYTPMIGNGYFSTLFDSNPNLSLFVTTTSTAGWENIVKTGGGLRVNFMDK